MGEWYNNSMVRSVTRRLGGWGNYPIEECRIFRPERVRELHEIVTTAAAPSLLSRGLGRSYGDASLNPHGVILHERLNRMLAFDPQSGVLECEAGVSFADIIEVFQPMGFGLPTTPGTKFVTVGGAIAADVHGKNHHRVGSFSRFVVDLKLLLADGSLVACSPDKEPALFWATCGGMGLTGHIVSARLRLARLRTAYVRVDYVKTASLDDTLAAFASGDDAYEHSVCWFDCLARGRSLGRAVLMRANAALPEDLPAARRAAPFTVKEPLTLGVPFQMPGSLLNSLSVRAFNTVFYARHATRAGVLVDNETFFYPLDRVANWNRMYGRAGFLQYQVLFPTSGAEAGLRIALDMLSRNGIGSFLAVLKRMGPRTPGPLSFPDEGFTLALDIPQPSPTLVLKLHAITQIVAKAGGKVYLAKDAVTRPEAFQAMYPGLASFRALRDKIDPEHRLSSTQARRLGIAPAESGARGEPAKRRGAA